MVLTTKSVSISILSSPLDIQYDALVNFLRFSSSASSVYIVLLLPVSPSNGHSRWSQLQRSSLRLSRELPSNYKRILDYIITLILTQLLQLLIRGILLRYTCTLVRLCPTPSHGIVVERSPWSVSRRSLGASLLRFADCINP